MPVSLCSLKYFTPMRSAFWPSVWAAGIGVRRSMCMVSSIQAANESLQKKQAFTYMHYVKSGPRKVETLV
jgi:hypothetical protein